MYGIGFSCVYLSLNGDSCQLFRNNSTIFSFNFFHPLLGVSLFMLLPFSLPEIFQSESFWCNMIIEICVPVFVDVFRVFVTYLICAHWMALRLNLHNSENEARRTYLFFDFSLALSLSLYHSEFFLYFPFNLASQCTVNHAPNFLHFSHALKHNFSFGV